MLSVCFDEQEESKIKAKKRSFIILVWVFLCNSDNCHLEIIGCWVDCVIMGIMRSNCNRVRSGYKRFKDKFTIRSSSSTRNASNKNYISSDRTRECYG